MDGRAINMSNNVLVGNSEATKRLKESILQVSKTDITVLITGETGVGKEIVASEIHNNSLRKNNPYIKINCAAIPEELLESELFGYEKGAFTGADHKEKLGLFQIADGGTILLDEIGEMPVKLQSKLLRVLQEKEFRRVGGIKDIKINVRIIAATNKNLHQLIKECKFREDLYYRLNVFEIKILPLRERVKDIPLLASYFIEKFNIKYNKSKIFEEEAINRLKHYNWPGNIRELENTIECLVVANNKPIISKDDITTSLEKEGYGNLVINYNSFQLKKAVSLLEKNIIEKALKECGSTYKAAEILGIKQSTVVKKAKALGIKR